MTSTLRLSAPPPTEVVTTVAFSADTGASATDFVTNAAAQTISGTLSARARGGRRGEGVARQRRDMADRDRGDRSTTSRWQASR